MIRRLIVLLPLLSMASAACASALPEPARAVHPARAFIEVPYPPPAALVEVVPARPEDGDELVWVDGHWVWRGRYYVWQRGGWIHPPENGAYASWQAMLSGDGRLLFAPGAWYDETQRELPPPAPRRVARTPPNQLTPETEAAR